MGGARKELRQGEKITVARVWLKKKKKNPTNTIRGSWFSKDVFSVFLKQILVKCILNVIHTTNTFRPESYF